MSKSYSNEGMVGQSQDQRPEVGNNFYEEKQMKIKNKSLFLIGPKKREAYIAKCKLMKRSIKENVTL